MTELQNIFINKIDITQEYFFEFCEISKVVTYKKNAFIINEGSVCNFIGFVETGIVRSFIKKEEVQYNNAFYFPNSFFSAYNSFINKKPAISIMQAMTETTARLISYDQLQNLQNTSPVWFKFGKYVADEFFIRKCERESSLLRDTALERYHALLKLYPNIEQLIPQYQIASYLKIKPESLSSLKALTYIKEK